MKDWLTALIVVSGVLTFQLWEYVQDKYCMDIFYMGYAFCFLLASIKIYLTCGKVDNYWSMILVLLSFNNLMDEMFLDPTKETLIEVLLLPIVLLIMYKKHKNARKLEP